MSTYKALVLGKEDSDASVDFADGKRDEHGGLGGEIGSCLLLHGCLRLKEGEALRGLERVEISESTNGLASGM